MQNLEKPKHKHNKKRNTAFLFESLIKELTKTIISGDKTKQKEISSLIKEHFKKNSPLDRELVLYKQIYETKQFPREYAEKLIKEVREQHGQLDDTEIFNEQSKLIAKLNKFFGPAIYDNFIPNYKVLASVSQVLNKNVEPKRKILLEQELVEHITEPEKTKATLEPLDKFTMSRFVEKFNEVYGKNLLDEQKELLSKYINSVGDTVDLKIYLNEEIGRLKNELRAALKTDIIKENSDLENNVKNVAETIQNFKIETIDEELIKRVMIIQEFVSEVKK